MRSDGIELHHPENVRTVAFTPVGSADSTPVFWAHTSPAIAERRTTARRDPRNGRIISGAYGETGKSSNGGNPENTKVIFAEFAGGAGNFSQTTC